MDGYDAQGYNAGYEFHHYPYNKGWLPRPPGGWPVEIQNYFRNHEANYQTAVEDGVLPPIKVPGKRLA